MIEKNIRQRQVLIENLIKPDMKLYFMPYLSDVKPQGYEWYGRKLEGSWSGKKKA